MLKGDTMAKTKSSGSFRSAVSGRYVTKAHGKRSPGTTVFEKTGGGPTGSARSAKSGRFVKEGYANKNPRTTVRES